MTAVVAWAVSRQMYLSGRRRPVTIAVFATVISCGAVWSSATVGLNFKVACSDVYEGVLAELNSIGTTRKGLACQVGGIAGNSYVPGALIRPAWNGQVSGILWVYLGIVATFSSVALRDVRVRPTCIEEVV